MSSIPGGPAPSATPVLVTRVADEAERWVSDLRAHGVAAEPLPLLGILPMADPAPLQACWTALAQWRALMFVSVNAVRHFFAARPAAVQPPAEGESASTRFLCTGPGTRAALLAQGVAAHAIDSPPEQAAQYDSEALWQVVGTRDWRGARVLIVRGGDEASEAGGDGRGDGRGDGPGSLPAGSGRDWLGRQWRSAGAEPHYVQAYRRAAPQLDARQQQRMQAARSDGSIWLFSSSQALAHLQVLAPPPAWQQARALATHPRIADAARAAGFGVVCETRPALSDVVRSIESMT